VRRVSRRDARTFTRASFTIHDRQPGVKLTYDKPPSDPTRRRSDEAISDATIRNETQRP
jgi:alkaline phosphatase D